MRIKYLLTFNLSGIGAGEIVACVKLDYFHGCSGWITPNQAAPTSLGAWVLRSLHYRPPNHLKQHHWGIGMWSPFMLLQLVYTPFHWGRSTLHHIWTYSCLATAKNELFSRTCTHRIFQLLSVFTDDPKGLSKPSARTSLQQYSYYTAIHIRMACVYLWQGK